MHKQNNNNENLIYMVKKRHLRHKNSKISWYNLELIDKKKNEMNVLFKCLSLNKKYVHEKENLHIKREKCPLNIQL